MCVVTFLHTKFMVIDKKRTSVSSINFSRTSFTKNREAGAIIDGADAKPLIDMMLSTYESDFAQAS